MKPQLGGIPTLQEPHSASEGLHSLADLEGRWIREAAARSYCWHKRLQIELLQISGNRQKQAAVMHLFIRSELVSTESCRLQWTRASAESSLNSQHSFTCNHYEPFSFFEILSKINVIDYFIVSCKMRTCTVLNVIFSACQVHHKFLAPGTERFN